MARHFPAHLEFQLPEVNPPFPLRYLRQDRRDLYPTLADYAHLKNISLQLMQHSSNIAPCNQSHDYSRVCGPMDKASVYGTGDSRFDPWQTHKRLFFAVPDCGNYF